MIIHQGYENLKLISPVVTLGIFDGVHCGHKTLIEFLVMRAKELKGESVVITFSPHPRQVLEQNSSDLSFLTTMEEKQVLLNNLNVDNLIIIEFNRQFSKIDACDFIRDVLVEKIRMKHLIIGFNHHFGRMAEGDYKTILKCSEKFSFAVEQVPGFQTEEGAISSTAIRDALLNGRLDQANSWLGYDYSISGTVIKGRQIGHSLGFPTANIKPESPFKLVPANGVYAVRVQLGEETCQGMLSIGSNPTVNDDYRIRSIEVNILNFSGDIYGRKITVIFHKWLRSEKKFDNPEQLSQQMELDKQETLRAFA